MTESTEIPGSGKRPLGNAGETYEKHPGGEVQVGGHDAVGGSRKTGLPLFKGLIGQPKGSIAHVPGDNRGKAGLGWRGG